MLWKVVLSLIVATAISLPTSDAPENLISHDSDYRASHIFNAVHSSMRQWGSSWNHNGMSLFLATVPANTEFYHGDHVSDPVKGIEWLAFEPEHALVFASLPPPPLHGPHGPHHQPPPFNGPPSGTPKEIEQTRIVLQTSQDDHHAHPPPRYQPRPLVPGYMHTYRTKHPLSLLYVDGLSAGKCRIGTLDSQDYLLLDWPPQNEPVDFFDEGERAEGLCNMAKTRWSGKIHGFIRMEPGFEIILCDFQEHLNFVEAIRIKPIDEPSNTTFPYDTLFMWYHAIAARFDGIGSNRVALNYDDFVTAFSYNVDIFPDGPGSMPRLRNLSRAELAVMRTDVDRMILSNDLPFYPRPTTTNWQAVADMIVTRYSSALPAFAESTDLTNLHQKIYILLRPFIDFTTPRVISSEIDRCTRHFLPPAIPAAVSSPPHHDSTTAKAITSISHRICNTLFSILDLPTSPSSSSITPATTLLQDLISYLDWPIWRRCPNQCAYDEVCFIPIWPLGTVQDRKSGVGQCRNASAMRHNKGQSYWFLPGEEPGPPRRGGDGQ